MMATIPPSTNSARPKSERFSIATKIVTQGDPFLSSRKWYCSRGYLGATLRCVTASIKKHFFPASPLNGSGAPEVPTQAELTEWLERSRREWAKLSISQDLQDIVQQILTDFADDPEGAQANLEDLVAELRNSGIYSPRP